jgi:hypothetical protein
VADTYVEYCSTSKKNEILLFEGKYMELEIIMLTKKKQMQKDKYHVFSHMWKRINIKGQKVKRVIGEDYV